MTGQNRDPFELLGRIDAPEADPAVAQAVAAASAAAFSARQAQGQPAATPRPWYAAMGNWAFPALGGAVAVVAAIGVLPLLTTPGDRAPAPTEMPAREVVADAETPADEAPARMGAVPPPIGQGLPLDMRDDVVVDAYSFGDLELVVRSAPETVGVYLRDGEVETQFDTRAKQPDETVTVTDAFVEVLTDGTEVLALRSGYAADAQQWDVFVADGARYALSGSLSTLVSDAVDRAEVIARLSEAQ